MFNIDFIQFVFYFLIFTKNSGLIIIRLGVFPVEQILLSKTDFGT